MSRRMLGHYEILEPLGKGGMGEVFRARDTHLEREVALKVLTGELARDEALMARFEREAKLLAAVDHPNIAGIHSIERASGKPFLVLELVDGEPLSKRLAAGPLPLQEALEVCRQVAGALAAAHSRQVVHRDLKPANVMVTPEGTVKLLDFGVAKTVAGAPAHPGVDTGEIGADEITSTGLVLGTAPYMSPEQVRGKILDPRSDVWSFGCVVFETLTGRPAFKHQTVGDTLAAIVTGDVDWDSLPEGTPEAIEALLRRCLQTDPRRRLHDIAEARQTIQQTLLSLSGAVTASAPRRPGPGRRWTWAAGAVALIAAALLSRGAWIDRFPTGGAGLPPGIAARVMPLTSLVGSEIDPALSPDGRFVAFSWDGDDGAGDFDLYVQQVGSGDPLRLTRAEVGVREPAWSPDGRHVVFLHRLEGGWRVASVPSLGGPVLSLGSVSPVSFPGLDYSSAGERLAVVHRPDRASGESIFLMSARTGDKTRLSAPPQVGMGDRHPVFSPDGESVAFVRWYESPLNEIHVSDLSGRAEMLVSQDAYVEGLAWLADGSGLVFSAARGGASSLWQVDLDGTLQPLGFGDGARGVAVADGTMVYSRRQLDTNLWIVGGPAGPRPTAPRRLIASTRDDWAPDYSPDGTRIAFMSIRSGDIRVWVCTSEGEECAQLETEGLASTPRWSPDGTRIAFGGEADGNTDIKIIDVDGGAPRRVVSGSAVNLASGWSADGRWLYLTSDRTGEYQVWKVDVDSGELVQLTRGGGLLPVGSGDGRFVYYIREADLVSIWRVPVDGGDETQILEHPGLSLSAFTEWDGKLLFFLQEAGDPVSLQMLDPETGETGELFRFDTSMQLGRYGRMTVSPDGRWIVYPQEDGAGSDLMLVSGFPATATR